MIQVFRSVSDKRPAIHSMLTIACPRGAEGAHVNGVNSCFNGNVIDSE